MLLLDWKIVKQLFNWHLCKMKYVFRWCRNSNIFAMWCRNGDGKISETIYLKKFIVMHKFTKLGFGICSQFDVVFFYFFYSRFEFVAILLYSFFCNTWQNAMVYRGIKIGAFAFSLFTCNRIYIFNFESIHYYSRWICPQGDIYLMHFESCKKLLLVETLRCVFCFYFDTFYKHHYCYWIETSVFSIF